MPGAITLLFTLLIMYAVYPMIHSLSSSQHLSETFKGKVHFETFFADSDAEFVVVTPKQSPGTLKRSPEKL